MRRLNPPSFSRRAQGVCGRRRMRAFTMIELLVSLMAGLIVSMGVVGLSRVATNTFHEETRASGTELGLRVASERLRADLARASFMSTPNIQSDSRVSLPKGASYIVPNVALPNLGTLAGVAYTPHGSVSATDSDTVKVATLSTENGISPDSILLGGNFTTADEYVVQSILPTTSGGCSGQTVTLSSDSAAVLRQTLTANGAAKTATDAAAAMRDAFQPVVNATDKGQFMVRVVDDSGHAQFAALCESKSQMVSITTGGASPIVQLHLDPRSPILDAFGTGGSGGTTGFGVGRLTINPVQLIRWSIKRQPNARLDPGVTAQDDAKFDLVRTWVDAAGAEVRSELVAEYAVDLSFAFGQNASGSNFVATDFGEAAPLVAPLTLPPTIGSRPQALRTVRFRLSIRTPTADRKEPLGTPDGGGFIYRYCTTPGGCATTKAYARVRTIVTEVSLPNQIR
jgi:Tfp pilus assembly protein PilW